MITDQTDQTQTSAPSEATITVDIPGVGTKAFPASMPPAQIEANAQVLMREAAARTQAQASASKWAGNTRGPNPMNVLTPEVLSGVAGFLAPETGGLSLAIPAAVGAGSSVAHDVMSGETSPIENVAGRALLHGATGAIPGGVGMAMRGGRAVKGALSAAGNMGGRTGIVARMMSILAPEAPATASAAGPAAAAATGTGVETMILPSGARVASIVGLKEIEQAMIQLAQKGKTVGDPQFDALRALYQQGHAARQARMATAPSLMATAKMGITNASQRASTAAQQAAQQAAQSARQTTNTVVNSLRAILAGGSVAGNATSPQRQPYQ